MLARLAPHIPSGEYAYEVKWDGVRAVAYIDDKRLRLLSRNNRDITVSYPELKDIARKFPARNAILDGEIVALNASGLPDFERLQHRMHVRDAGAAEALSRSIPITYMIFDLLYFDDSSLIEAPYASRREKLFALNLMGQHWSVPEHFIGDPAPFLEATRKMGIEGVMAKRLDSSYFPGRRNDAWLKIKHVRKQEFVIAGWQDGQGARSGVPGALLLGYYDVDPEEARRRHEPQKLVYAGKVGTGFSTQALKDIQTRLRKHAIAVNPFNVDPPRERGTHFARPELVAEIRFGSWTSTHMLRHRVVSRAARRQAARRRRAGGMRRRGGSHGTAHFGPGRFRFGLVNVPVKMVTAVSSNDIHFHQLRASDGARIQYKKVSATDQKEVDLKDIVKGYEIAPNQYVKLKPEELESLDPEKSQTIDIDTFVDLDQIDPIYYEHTYYLEPDKNAGRAYVLLLDAMRDSGKVGIAKMVLHGREHVVALRAMDQAIALSTLYFRDEIIPVENLELPSDSDKPQKKELEIAVQLIDAISGKFEPETFHDEYRNRVMDLIQRKAEGKEVVAQKMPKTPRGNVVSLMDALKASIAESARKKKDGAHERQARSKPKARKSA